jgi:putative CocE/NonD family hydrolase
MKRIFPVVLVIMLLRAGHAPAEPKQPADVSQRYTARDFMIPMRDGIRLHTMVYVPRATAGPLPFLFLRTPYGIAQRSPKALKTSLEAHAREGYLFVFQDIRGRYQSEGQFVMNRTPRDRADPKSIDEGTDAYDTIAWLLKNMEGHNGRVGMLVCPTMAG